MIRFRFAGKSIAQVALKWLLQKDIVSSVIIGVKTLEQLEDNLGASGDWRLTAEQVQLHRWYFVIEMYTVGSQIATM